MKLIFFGGCFNPPHKGHVEIIRKCVIRCDQFLLMPTLHSPLKNVASSPDPSHIVQMLKLIIQDIDQSILVDEYDLARTGLSYTVDTVRYLKEKYSHYSISMVIGADQLIKFEQWKDYLDIIKSINIIGIPRKDYNFIPITDMNFTWIKNFNMDISSDNIRRDIASGVLNVDDLTSSVRGYIFKNKMYGYE